MRETMDGGCLCGAVRFTIEGSVRDVVYCHCGQCRKQTGLYYAASNAANEQITITGEDHITWYRSSDSGRRGFCKTCGSALFWRSEGSDHLSVMAGAFDEPDRLKAGFHIYCDDKAGFYSIDDGLKQYPQSD